MIDPELLAILACPLEDSRPPLRQEGDRLICDSCGKAFPIVDGVPRLTPESAQPLENQEKPQA